MTASNMMSTFVHHGMIYVPLGYSQSSELLGNLDEAHGGGCFLNDRTIGYDDLIRYIITGSAWGAGTLSAADGSREVSRLELEAATLQGKQFYEILSRVKF